MPDIACKTDHSLETVDRYIKYYEYEGARFLVCRSIDSAQIQHMTGSISSVVKQHIKIIERCHLDEIKNED